ncbi:MAG: S8 family serine peptidase [Proteobacteria bacterium]|nr:S8 family serine peptidase [Pseudomonadota bacterium]
MKIRPPPAKAPPARQHPANKGIACSVARTAQPANKGVALALTFAIAIALAGCGGGGGGGGGIAGGGDSASVGGTPGGGSGGQNPGGGSGGTGGDGTGKPDGSGTGGGDGDGMLGFLGTPSKVAFANATHYLATHEFLQQIRNSRDTDTHNHLVEHKFHEAYARGWTGNGSLVVIADTGANLNHPDLKDNILHYKNFIFSNVAIINPQLQTHKEIRDKSWHGTLVAGIVAGVKDNRGMHGVAYDAKLAIAKLGKGRFFSAISENLPNVYSWANTINATVINHSFSFRDADSSYNRSVRAIPGEEGSWYSTDDTILRDVTFPFVNRLGMRERPQYTRATDGFFNAKELARRARDNVGNETVLVFSSGNEHERDYSYGNKQMATATENGKLILDGRVLIAGWWDYAHKNTNGTRRGRSRGNKAGNVCVTWNATAKRCEDAAKISDFFILADGRVYSTFNLGDSTQDGRQDEEYDVRDGSSFSAPIVSGAVAIIHQMWPHMRGKHIVQLLLDTADNQSIHNYREHVHGQGLLDMEAATNPVGVPMIPRDGRVNSTLGRMRFSGGVHLVGGLSLAAAEALGEVMVLDSYDRDFYLPLSHTIPPVTLAGRGVGVGDAGWWRGDGLVGWGGGSGGVASPYAAYFAPDQHVLLPPLVLGGGEGMGGGVGMVADEGSAGGDGSGRRHQVQFGMGTSYGHVLGNRFYGILGTSRHSYTLYGLYNYNYGGAGAGSAGAGVGLYGQLGMGVSYGAFDKAGSLLDEAEMMVSSTARLGYGFALGEAGWLGVSVGQPIALERARVRYDVPVGRTLDGRVVREARVVDFRAETGQREVDVGVELGLDVGAGRLAGFAEARTLGLDFGDDGNEGRVGVRFGREF